MGRVAKKAMGMGFFLFLFCCLTPFTWKVFADTATVYIDYICDNPLYDCVCSGGDYGCDGVVPGGQTYICSDDPYSWNDGNRDFSDPLPNGAVLTHVSVRLYGECDPTTTTYRLNDQLIETVDGPFGPCACTCPAPKTYSSAAYPDGFPGYRYGGTNTLNLSETVEESELGGCYYAAEVTLTYTGEGYSVPTLSGWGVLIMAGLFSLAGAAAIVVRKKRPLDRV